MSLRMMRAHWRDLVATLIALTLGVAISTAALLVYVSARPGVPTAYERTAAIVQAPPGGVDAENFPEYVPWDRATVDTLTTRLRDQPAIASAIAVRTFYAQPVINGNISGSHSAEDPQGRSWSSIRLGPYRLNEGRAPTGTGSVVLSKDYNTSVGQHIQVLTVHGPRAVQVSGHIDGPGVYFADDAAAALAGGTTVIGLLPASGARPAEVSGQARTVLAASQNAQSSNRAAANSRVLTGADRAQAEPEFTGRTRNLGAQLLTLMLLLTVFASVFVVSQTFALATTHRRRDLALLRALGGTPWQTRCGLFREAATIGIVGSVLGVIAGLSLAPTMGNALVDAGLQPTGFEVRASPAIFASLLLGPALAVLATWAAVRRSAGVSPLEAIRAVEPGQERLGPLRFGFGLMCALGAATSALTAGFAESKTMSSWAAIATLLAVIAVTSLGPIVLPPLVRISTWPLTRMRGAGGMLVSGSMTSATSRTTSTVAPVLATMALATLILGYVETGRSAYGGADLPQTATAVITPGTAPGLTEVTVDAANTATRGMVDDSFATQTWVGAPGSATVVTTTATRAVSPGRVHLSMGLAQRLGVKSGSTVPVTLPDGTHTRLTVDRVEPGSESAMMLPRELVRLHDPIALTGPLVLTGTMRADVPALRQLERLGVQIMSTTDYADSANAEEYRLLRMFTLVGLSLALGYTLLSVANTFAMSAGARSRDLTLLRLAGAGPGQVRRVLFCEGLTTVAVGAGLGLMAGMVGVLGIQSGLSREAERHIPISLPWVWLLVLVAACAVLAGISNLWPLRRLLGDSPRRADR